MLQEQCSVSVLDVGDDLPLVHVNFTVVEREQYKDKLWRPQLLMWHSLHNTLFQKEFIVCKGFH